MSSENSSRSKQIRKYFKEYNEAPFISHEWEELVEKLSQSDDPKLRQIGLLESEFKKIRLTALTR